MEDGNEGETPPEGSDGAEAPAVDEVTEPPTSGGEPPAGFVRMREALLGVGLLWLAAIAAFGALQAAIFGLTTSPAYLAVAAGAATLSAGAGYASLRAFGVA